MKKYLFFVSLFLLIIASCTNDVSFWGDEYSQETADLRKSFYDKVVGDWTYKKNTPFSYLEQNYSFQKDGTLKGYILLKKRDSVFVNGSPTLTDWYVVLESDIAGKWDLFYQKSQKKNVLFFDGKGKYGESKFIDFFTANDTILDIWSPLLFNERITLHRKELKE